jgi:Flp pilus assembly secretin CpaC
MTYQSIETSLRAAIAIMGIQMATIAVADVTITPVPVAKTVVAVGIGRSVVLRTDADIKAASSANPNVCSVVVSPDTRNFILTGTHAGVTTVTLLFDPTSGSSQTFQIKVGRDSAECQEIADFIKQQFPDSKVSLTPVPASSKVIVKGKTTSTYQRHRILEIIEAMIPHSDVIDMLTCTCTCYSD